MQHSTELPQLSPKNPMRIVDPTGCLAPGYAALWGVALLWGTYAPTLRYLFLMDRPPSPALLTVTQSSLSALFLLTAALSSSIESDSLRSAAESQNGDDSSPESIRLLAKDAHRAQDNVATRLSSLARSAEEQAVEISSTAMAASGMGASASRDGQLSSIAKDTAPLVLGTPDGKAALGGISSPAPRSVPHHLSQLPARALQRCRGALQLSFSSLPLAGLELGVWNFCGIASAATGLSLTSATKAAFLTQSTALMVPMLSFLSGDPVAPIVWFACSLGLVGSGLVAADGLSSSEPSSVTASLRSVAVKQASASDAAANLSMIAGPPLAAESGGFPIPDAPQGQLFIILSCFFYALATVRLGRYSSRFQSIQLACSSAVSSALLALLWLCGDILFGQLHFHQEIQV